MRKLPLFLVVILVLLIVTLYYFSNKSEGFETMAEKVRDRTNPMAQGQNPLTNPAVPIGVSEVIGAQLTNINQVALNVPKLMSNGAGSFTQVAPDDPISPRVDNENSYLGLVQMCKTKGVGDTPFNDPAFAANCGMCLTKGKLKTGESFTTPTGVLIYQQDKTLANNERASNGYVFPRVIPSLDSATCEGASRSDDSKPVLAINQKDFDAFRKRINCINSHGLGNECAQCVSNQQTSWVPANAGIQPIKLWLWGAGAVVVTIGGQVPQGGGDPSNPVNLSNDTAVQLSLGRVPEGTTINIKVTKGTSSDGPYLYGAITSTTPANKLYKLAIEKFLEIDKVSGSFPRRGSPKYFSDIKIACVKLLPQPTQTSMALDGFLPVTFVEQDQLAAYDCPTSPLVSSQASAELFIRDPCLNPRGQGPKNYTDECMQKTILDAGCSTNGDWYKNLPPPNERNFPRQMYTGLLKWVNDTFGTTVPAVSSGCRGIDISTPCDAFIGGGIPNKACMAYLYSNESEKNPRVGRTYNGAQTTFTSKSGKNIQFCQPQGSLNPASANGLTILQEKAAGYNGYTGIDAVRKYLSDVFTKATGNLDVNVSDDKGGRKDSWNQCIGLPIADYSISQVNKNSINDVINNKASCLPMPQTLDLLKSQGRIIGNVNITGDYTLSFDITPRGLQGGWGNIIHFTMNNSDGSRCPAIWFFPGDTRLHVRIGDVNDWNWGIDTNPLPMHQKSSVRIECVGSSVTVSVNGNIWRVTQPSRRPTGPAIVYGTNPWYAPANAYVENLCYSGGSMLAQGNASYDCVSYWDHGGADLACYGSGQTRQSLEDACTRNPNCKSYNTFGASGGCIKNTASKNITNRNDNVTLFCVKNT
jgi:hypothetical protein